MGKSDHGLFEGSNQRFPGGMRKTIEKVIHNS